jgi:hypothetical protein
MSRPTQELPEFFCRFLRQRRSLVWLYAKPSGLTIGLERALADGQFEKRGILEGDLQDVEVVLVDKALDRDI